MKRAIVALMATFVAFSATSQEMVATDGKDEVRLSLNPCMSLVILSKIPPQHRDSFYAASAVVGGEKFVACWRKVGSHAHVLYEDGDSGLIPMNLFSQGI